MFYYFHLLNLELINIAYLYSSTSIIIPTSKGRLSVSSISHTYLNIHFEDMVNYYLNKGAVK